MRKFVFGMGSGCCGTASLAWLLNSQENSFVGHELFPLLRWANDYNAQSFFAKNKWEQLNHESHLYELVGDVATYYLPYVRFLIDNINNKMANDVQFRFIILKREKKEVIEAFIDKFERQGNNPLQNTVNVKNDEWDDCFPKYPSNFPQELAIECYWEDYYAEAQWLADNHPQMVRIFKTEDLNSEDKVRDLLQFAGVTNPKVMVGVRKNKRSDL